MQQRSLPQEEHDTINKDLEIALVKIARTLYDYVNDQDNAKKILAINRLMGSFDSLVADYYNQTGRLHPDLCYELGEWVALKAELLELPSRSADAGVTTQLVEEYRIRSLHIVESLERQLRPASAQ